MLKFLVLKIFKKTVRFLKPLLRIVAEEADLALFYPRLAMGQHPLVFKDNENVLKNNIPKSVYFNTRSGKITIGSNTVFGEYVMLLTGKHNFISDIKSEEELHQVPEDGRDIEIGDNCYIGSGAIIIGPVRIGDYAVIGAGAVVTKDVMSGTLVGGVPATKIKDLNSK